MKQISVSAAIIVKDNKIFITQRGYGEYIDRWEFPGGKIEAGESPVEAIHREIKEELDAQIIIDEDVGLVEWDYPNFHLSMHCFLCHLAEDHIALHEHEAARFVSINELEAVDFLPADVLVVQRLKDRF